jgi:hypothetical protein
MPLSVMLDGEERSMPSLAGIKRNLYYEEQWRNGGAISLDMISKRELAIIGMDIIDLRWYYQRN